MAQGFVDFAFLIGVLATSTAVACGDKPELFGEVVPEPSGQGGATSVTTTTSDSSASSAGGMASSSGVAVSSNASGTGGAGGGPVQTTMSSSDVASSTATGQMTGPFIACGMTTCSNGAACCFSASDPAKNVCAEPGNCPNGTAALECMGSSDCPNQQKCCAAYKSVGQNKGYTSASCKDSCLNGLMLGELGIEVCSDGMSMCPFGTSCKSSQILPMGFEVCVN